MVSTGTQIHYEDYVVDDVLSVLYDKCDKPLSDIVTLSAKSYK